MDEQPERVTERPSRGRLALRRSVGVLIVLAVVAAGAWLGGLAIAAGWGFASTGWVGAGLGVLGLAVFCVSWRLERRRR